MGERATLSHTYERVGSSFVVGRTTSQKRQGRSSAASTRFSPARAGCRLLLALFLPSIVAPFFFSTSTGALQSARKGSGSRQFTCGSESYLYLSLLARKLPPAVSAETVGSRGLGGLRVAILRGALGPSMVWRLREVFP